VHVEFKAVNGFVMANCCPLGSAFDDDWKSLLAILLPER
jgi:hypothetical protein